MYLVIQLQCSLAINLRGRTHYTVGLQSTYYMYSCAYLCFYLNQEHLKWVRMHLSYTQGLMKKFMQLLLKKIYLYLPKFILSTSH